MSDTQAAENFREGLAEVEAVGRKANDSFYGPVAYTPGKDEGRTGGGLATFIDVEQIFDAEGDDEASDVRFLFHPSQAAKLIELLKLHIDLDVVALDNDEPETALFVRDLIATYEEAVAQ